MEELQPARVLADLNARYLLVHQAKEELFWATYMGTSDDHEGAARAETGWKSFISDPANLALARRAREACGDPGPADWGRAEDVHGAHPEFAEGTAWVAGGLDGWIALFEANLIEDVRGREFMEDLVRREGALFAARRDLALRHVDESGSEVAASLPSLATNLAANPKEEARRSSFMAFRALEHWVLDNGFADIVVARNRLARSLGFRNYFDMKVRKTEGMSPEELFAILDDFEVRTRPACRATRDALAARLGPDAVEPWNFRFHSTGDVSRQMDPYMGIDTAVERWITGFRRMGITFRGATLQLDLLDRPGKYQNGFCHGPVPCHWDSRGKWVPGHINFTSLARPGQVGSGQRALETLYHEGGHAAHFANTLRNSPCFSQEFPPTSMAFAETQSMFCDSLLDDADWLWRYARNAAGDPPPDSLLRRRVEASQPVEAFNARQILLVAAFEWPLYCMSDEELGQGPATGQALLDLARDTERRILGMESPRPLLAIPHLLNEESAASYHGYLLARMAVEQVREWFLSTQGSITDNPRVGPLLARHFWAPGNSVTLDQALRSLTGRGFSAAPLADACSRSVEEAWETALALLDRARKGSGGAGLVPESLDAFVRVVHGAVVVGDSSRGEEALAREFASWVKRKGGQVS